MEPDKANAKVESNATSSLDEKEQQAAELARREGREKTTNADRKNAMAQQEAVAPPTKGQEEASH